MSTTSLNADSIPYPFPAARWFCESWWTCFSGAGTKHRYRRPFVALLAPLEEISVLLPSIRNLYDIEIRPEPRWGRRRIPRWHGIPCRIGRAEMWVPVSGENQPLFPFSLLVRIPKRDPPPHPPEPLPFVLLGTQFLVEYEAKLELDGPSGKGKLSWSPGLE